jgi:hypothetical protein
VREFRSLGSVRGAPRNGRPYRESKESLSARGVRVRLLRLTCRAADRPVPPKMTQSGPPIHLFSEWLRRGGLIASHRAEVRALKCRNPPPRYDRCAHTFMSVIALAATFWL